MPVEIPGYTIETPLASGASGTVYRAIQNSLGRAVALKILAPGLFDAGETRARFLREAKLQAALAHPNLLTVFDAGFVDGQPYLATELAQGGSLRECLSTEPRFSLSRGLEIAGEIASGIAAAHDAGIIHRDLKPDNVQLRPSLARLGTRVILGFISDSFVGGPRGFMLREHVGNLRFKRLEVPPRIGQLDKDLKMRLAAVPGRLLAFISSGDSPLRVIAIPEGQIQWHD